MHLTLPENPRILVTGGPTRAHLDKVRFLTNVSTGELAYLLCAGLCRRKASVSLVAGPTAQPWEKLSLNEMHRVETTEEMSTAVLKSCRNFKPQIAVFAAAVLDFAPRKTVMGKVSSQKRSWVIRLQPTPKIMDQVAAKFPKIRKIGFKLEYKHPQKTALEEFALHYIHQKGLEVLCVNFLQDIGQKKHRGYLFTKAGLETVAGTKEAIASKLSHYIFHGQFSR